MKMYQALAHVAMALNNPSLTKTALNYQTQRLDQLVKLLPSGSGFDAGTEFLTVASGSKKLIFKTAYHHMDEHGGYCGWTEHEVIVTPCLDHTGIDMRVTKKDKNNIKEYILEVFFSALQEEAPEYRMFEETA